jgi:hypothetical protein
MIAAKQQSDDPNYLLNKRKNELSLDEKILLNELKYGKIEI